MAPMGAARRPVASATPAINLICGTNDAIYDFYSFTKSMYQVRMVAKYMQRELADMMHVSTSCSGPSSPKAALGTDCYLSSFTTIADIELSNNLQVCKMYVYAEFIEGKSVEHVSRVFTIREERE